LEVASRDEVERTSESGGAEELAIVQGFQKMISMEALDASPEAGERWAGLLGLESGESFDDSDGIECRPLQQQLAGEEGAVQSSLRDEGQAL
jgi:hypothetical protein